MKRLVALGAMIMGFLSYGYCQEGAASQATSVYNYERFTNDRKNITPELESLTDKEFKSHPEYGVLPYNAPCNDCIELLQKRDDRHRYFVKEGTNGKHFYAQTSYGSLSYYDEKGLLRTSDPRMKPTGQPGVFRAGNQPNPVTINIPQKFTSLLNNGRELMVNRDLSIYVKHKDGSLTSLGQPDWSDYTAGDDGMMVHNFYPGIDLELQLGKGKIESFYHINKPLSLGDGWLVVTDNMQVPQDLVLDYSYSEKKANDTYQGTLFFNDNSGNHHFFINSPAAYDVNNEKGAVLLDYQVTAAGQYKLFVSIDWMNDPSRAYPLVIDPLVSVVTSVPNSSINGAWYDPVCFKTGCPYNMDVAVPAACTVYDLLYSYNYRALNPCQLIQIGWDLTYQNCKSPVTVGCWHTCTINLPGLCILKDLSCYNSASQCGENMKNCIPAPQCPAYTMPFVLRFFRCTPSDVSPGCSFSCAIADPGTSWDMTVKGYYISVKASNQTVCKDSSVVLTALADSGVTPPAYTYKWYGDPSGNVLTGSSVTVSPKSNTVYMVTARDCPAIPDTLTDSASVMVNVTVYPNTNPGFTLSTDTACTGASVTYTANAGPGTSCEWRLPGASTNPVSGQQSATVTYATAGNYNVTLRWTDLVNGCVWDSILPMVIIQGNPPLVSISANPSGPICQGDQVTFTANPTNPGATPTYDWYLNNGVVPVQSGPSQTYTTTTLNNGDQIKVILNASGVSCGSPVVTSNTITMVVNPVLPAIVTIAVVPNGIICPGTSVTFTATPVNGGNGPGYKWQLNGTGNYGSGSTYTTSSLVNGDIVTVILTSNYVCPLPQVDTSNQIVMQVYPDVVVKVKGDTTICANQPVPICATASVGMGPPYFYTWDNGASPVNCPTVSPGVTTVYTVSAEDGCHTNPATASVTVTVTPPPLPNFIFSPNDVSLLTPTVYFLDQTANGSVVSWNFGDPKGCDVDTSSLTNPKHKFCKPGTYTVKLIAKNISQCLDSITYTVEVHDEYYYYVPNSFTPNNDGKNDYFALSGRNADDSNVQLPSYEMTIFNRWGEKIFETSASQPWSGKIEGSDKLAGTGVDVYRIKFLDPHYPTDKELVGAVTLIR